MKFLQDCWIALLELFNLATFSTTGGSSLQQALQKPNHQVPLPDHASKQPIFVPPNRPEDPNAVIKCDYSAMGKEWVSCSSPGDRNCWLAGPNGQRFDILTDYEKRSPIGITRKYAFTTENLELDTDGLVMPYGKVFNNNDIPQYPGPWIQACWGDTIEVTIHNKLKYNGTTIHWHGIRQLKSFEMDGVNAITQCPIAPGDSYTYRFNATQYGTSWYHSHYALQYGDGMLGPLTIYGPSSTGYDDVRDPILMTDWNHRSGFMDFHTELAPPPAPMDSILLNGQGSYAGGGNCGYKYNTTFERGKKYLLRLINTSTATTFVFTIDNHYMTVISTDFVPIHPYITDNIVIGIGQRYNVVVTALPKVTSPPANAGADDNGTEFWIRTIPAVGCSGFPIGGDPNERQGIIYYGNDTKILPRSTRLAFPLACRDEPAEKLVPMLQWEVGSASNVGENFEVGLQLYTLGQGHPLPFDNFSHWAIGHKPLYLNFSDPTILHLDNKTFNPDYVVIPEDYPDGAWIYFYIEAIFPNLTVNHRLGLNVSHPIHLHGHDFVILQQSNENITVNPIKLNLHNPPRRDVVLLPGGGYVVIAFKADNPGIWLLHCHIANHASSGLAMQILERHKQAEQQLTPEAKKEINRVCHKWNNWFADDNNHWHEPGNSSLPTFQEDSGI